MQAACSPAVPRRCGPCPQRAPGAQPGTQGLQLRASQKQSDPEHHRVKTKPDPALGEVTVSITRWDLGLVVAH